MWISKKKFKELEKRIADLEGQVQGQQEQIQKIEEGYQRQLNVTLSSIIGNLNIKERYNLELLKYLFEKFQIEEPKLEYKF